VSESFSIIIHVAEGSSREKSLSNHEVTSSSSPILLVTSDNINAAVPLGKPASKQREIVEKLQKEVTKKALLNGQKKATQTTEGERKKHKSHFPISLVLSPSTFTTMFCIV